MDVNRRIVGRLADRLEALCASPDRIVMPAGYRDSALALIDAIFSMQARYEGARRVVHNYATWAGLLETPGLPKNAEEPDGHDLRDLHSRVAEMPAADLIGVVFKNRSRSARANRLKGELVVEAAGKLIGVGLESRHDVAMWPGKEPYIRQKAAWSRIHGLGPVTFEYFRLLCGAESSKPDIMILGWLEGTLGRRPPGKKRSTLSRHCPTKLPLGGTFVCRCGVSTTPFGVTNLAAASIRTLQWGGKPT